MVGRPIGPRSWSGFQPLRLSSRLIVAGERRNTRAISRVLLFSCFIAKIAPRSSAPRCSYFCPMQHILNDVLHLVLETAVYFLSSLRWLFRSVSNAYGIAGVVNLSPSGWHVDRKQ